MVRNFTSTYSGVPDSELVVRAQRGDNEAFAELVQRHTPTAKRMAYSILRDRSDVEDEVQNALWKAYEHIGQFQQDAKFSTWLSRIVVNECLMRLRKERRMRMTFLDDGVKGEETLKFDLPDKSAGPENSLAMSEIGTVLREEIRRIPALLRDVFLLREVQELPMPEVAGRLGISVAAAKSWLLRARHELRLRLGRHCGRVGMATLLS